MGEVGNPTTASSINNSAAAVDPILPYLLSIGKAYDEYAKNPDRDVVLTDYVRLLKSCVDKFSADRRYKDDLRFLKILVLYGDAVQDFREVFQIMEEKGVGIGHSLLYDAAAMFHVAKGKVLEAQRIYLLGISRNATPVGKLKKAYSLFLDHLGKIAARGDSKEKRHNYASPWASSTINVFLKKLDSEIVKYNGYHKSSKKYPGKVALDSLRKNSKNKIVDLGGRKYLIKGCAGQGGFALVFKANDAKNADEIVALKIQSPAFPWEFYMYRQLDKRVSNPERSSFGFAHGVHIYSDWSILVCDYLSHGTLHDAINSYVVTNNSMNEILCIYYTIEMLRMLETLHAVGIIHGDFKPDNLLIRYSRNELTEDGFTTRSGPWSEQGLCLVDWGRGIDINLFPAGTEFEGDSRTSGFRCIQMHEKKGWTCQVDTYGLCVAVHLMLHGEYMSIEKKTTSNGCSYYQPKSSLKRYWNTELWKNLFSTLLNKQSKDNDCQVLGSLRKSFEDYLSTNPKLIRKLKELLVKQKASLCSA